MKRFATAAALLLLGLASLAAAGHAAAEPSEAQVDAVKANCRSDFLSNCSGVKRGGPEAMQCLKQYVAKLSPGCQQAVKAVFPPPAPAATAATPKAQPAAPAPAPAAETAPAAASAPEAESTAAMQSTPVAAPAPAPKSVAEPEPKPAPPAKSAATDAALLGKPAAPSVKAPEAPQAAAPEETPAIIGIIPPRKKLMVQRHCRDDLEAFCAGVEYGEGRQLRCLFSNKAALTPDCQGALAKLAR